MSRHWYRWQKDTLLLYVHLHPGAKINEVSGLLDNRLRVRVKSPPVDGKANVELITMLARDFGTKRAQVRIAGGETSRDKLIEIQSPAALPEWFGRLVKQKNPV